MAVQLSALKQSIAQSSAAKRLKGIGLPLLTVGIPIGYIVGEHIAWKKKKPDSLKRMIIQQTSFWLSAIGGLVLMHDTMFRRKPLRWKLPRYGLSSLLMIAGFAGGEKLAKLLYPKTVEPLLTAKPEIGNEWQNVNVIPTISNNPFTSFSNPAVSNLSPAMTNLNGLSNMQTQAVQTQTANAYR